MGLFLRKSLSVGPVRFNLSKSGLGMSAGVKGARIGVNSGGTYVAGGRNGVYFRKSLNTSGNKTRSTASTPVRSANVVATKALSAEPDAAIPSPGSHAIAAMLITTGTIWAASGVLLDESVHIPVGLGIIVLGILAELFLKRRTQKYHAYAKLLANLPGRRDDGVLTQITRQQGSINPDKWEQCHRFIYKDLLSQALNDGLDQHELSWLESIAKVLHIKSVATAQLEVVRPLMWELMADGEVDRDEEVLIEQVLKSLNISKNELSEEWDALEQFIRGRGFKDQLPTVEVEIPLQRNEVCHHATTGSFMEMKTIRTYTVDGERMKEQELKPIKEGSIYITSKRILMVGDGTSSIPHEKILEAEINQDEKTVSIIKDGRQKPLYLHAADAIYCGLLIERLSEKV